MKVEDLLRVKGINNTGFDNSTGNTSGRILNKDGSSNVIKSGISLFRRLSLYHTLLNLPLPIFILIAFAGFFLTNLFFAIIYYVLGIEAIGGAATVSPLHQFFDCFYFSAQTITTVGYGVLHPVTQFANFLATTEAVIGWMAFAVLTGLIYGRFSRPTAYLLFSKNALISPFQNGQALMFRLAPYKNNTLTEAEVLMNVAFRIHANGKIVNKFLPLKAEINKISSLSLNWTLVHEINEHSPFWGMCKEDFEINQTEILVFVKAYDEHFSNYVQQRTSYTFDEIIHGAKFVQMYRQSDNQKTTLLELNKIDDYTLV